MDTCCICCDDFKSKDKVRQTNCKHIFHSKCLMQWAKTKVTAVALDGSHVVHDPDCPYCKANLMNYANNADDLSVEDA